jgi:hypothetical protein
VNIKFPLQYDKSEKYLPKTHCERENNLREVMGMWEG